MPDFRKRTGRAALLALAAVALVPSAAQAATLNVEDGTYTYDAGAGVPNDLWVGNSGSGPAFTEYSGDLIDVTGDVSTCSGAGTSSVRCTIPSVGIVLNMGGDTKTDRVSNSYKQLPVTVNGGPGDDRLGGYGTLNGEDGDDLLNVGNRVSSVANVQNGGPGDDTLYDGDYAQTMNGGTGVDTADFSATGVTTSITLDGVTNDGAKGVDNVASDVENVRGGSGDDTITGSTADNLLLGGAGHDTLRGGYGADTLDGGTGPDDLSGGAGRDLVDYSQRSAHVVVTIGDAGPDGEADENDHVAGDVEDVSAGYGDDTLTGSSAANRLAGGPGDDQIQGLSGDDAIVGGKGDDVLDGGKGADTVTGGLGSDALDGGVGKDTLYGSDGADRLDGSAGHDVLSGGSGADDLFTRDGELDTADCGAGADLVVRDDAGDTVNADCETQGTEGGALEAPPLMHSPFARGR